MAAAKGRALLVKVLLERRLGATQSVVPTPRQHRAAPLRRGPLRPQHVTHVRDRVDERRGQQAWRAEGVRLLGQPSRVLCDGDEAHLTRLRMLACRCVLPQQRLRLCPVYAQAEQPLGDERAVAAQVVGVVVQEPARHRAQRVQRGGGGGGGPSKARQLLAQRTARAALVRLAQPAVLAHDAQAACAGGHAGRAPEEQQVAVEREHMQPNSLVHYAAPVRVVDAHAAVDVVAGGIDRAYLVLLRHRLTLRWPPASHAPSALTFAEFARRVYCAEIAEIMQFASG
eukprot:scaffold34862_cov61-Phaeocystis_antarctica.AAC.3